MSGEHDICALRKGKCEAAGDFLMENSVGSCNPEFKKERWEPESEWEANGNWYKWIFFSMLVWEDQWQRLAGFFKVR